MKVTVSTKQHVSTPFYNGAEEVKDAYGFDYKKACCTQSDFLFRALA
jgi:hypothetical protein